MTSRLLQLVAQREEAEAGLAQIDKEMAAEKAAAAGDDLKIVREKIKLHQFPLGKLKNVIAKRGGKCTWCGGTGVNPK
jgi:hypothetical protein